MDDGSYDKSFYYTIEGGKIKACLGEDKIYELTTSVSQDGDLTLITTEKNYVDSQDVQFLKSSIDKTFEHYEMKGNRTIERGDVTVFCSKPIEFAKDSKFSDSDLKIYFKVNYKNDSFLKKVYVRFNETMFKSDKEFSTAVVTPTSTAATCFYDGVNVELIYSVK